MKTRRIPLSHIYAALTGAMLTAACPPLNLYPLAWIGLIPLFHALKNSSGGGFGEGFAAGFVFNLGILYWLAFNTGADLSLALFTMFSTVMILALGWGTAAWLFKRILERVGAIAWLLIPFSWTAWEGALSHLGELSFPWPLLALTQARFDSVLQIMEYTGTGGVTFWVASANVIVFLTLLQDTRSLRIAARLCLIPLFAIPLLADLHARLAYRHPYPKVRVMAVQGNIPPELKWLQGAETSWAVYDSLTRSDSSLKPALVVWPETALPANLLYQSIYYYYLSRLADETGACILTGASDYSRVSEERRPLNASFLIKPGEGVVQRGAKLMLVPFGERVPFQWIAPQLGNLNFGQAEFLPGLYQTLFRLKADRANLVFPAMVCYESAFPEISRQAVLKGANLLTTISNDAWYGWSSEASQIVALSRFRCIETRRGMVRASNSGTSFICDHFGHILATTGLYVPATASGEIALLDVQTFFVAHGELFTAIVTGLFGLMLIIFSFSRQHHLSDAKTDESASAVSFTKSHNDCL